MSERISPTTPEKKKPLLERVKTAEVNEKKKSHTASQDTVLNRPDLGIFGVFDGLGGYTGGEIASQAAAAEVEGMMEALKDVDINAPEMVKQLLTDSLELANKRINIEAKKDPNLVGMATTATVAKMFEGPDGKPMLGWASVGDTRISIMHGNGELEHLSTDEIPDLEYSPNVISNALSTSSQPEHQYKGVDQKNLGLIELQPGDRVVLCSDGILGDWENERLSDDELKAALSEENPDEAVKKLIETSRKDDDKGVVVVDVPGTESNDTAPADDNTRKGRRKERTKNHNPSTPPAPKLTPTPTPTPVPTPDPDSPDVPRPDTRRTRETINVAAEEEWATKHFNEHVSLFDKKGNIENGKFVLEDVDVSEATKDLIEARSKLAEASTKARKGGILGNRRAAEELEDDEKHYQEIRKAFIEEQLEGLDDDVTPAQKRALLALLDAKEDGALMGEEANQYLAEEENQSILRKAQEKFEKLSPKKKAALVIGTAAVGIAVAGFTGGGLVVGGLMAVGKFGKGLFTGSAKRRGKSRSDIDKQQASTLRVSNHEQHEENMAKMSKLNKSVTDETLMKRRNKRAEKMNNAANAAIEAERKKESKEKRKVLGKAAIITALPGAGYALDDLLDFSGLKTDIEDLGNNLEDKVEDLQNQLSDTQAELTETQEQLADATDGGVDVDADASDGTEAGPEAPDTPEISAEAQHLYGEFAGQDMNITIPEGGNVWDQLEAQIDKDHPMMLDSEKQRLVANMVEAMESDFHRDLDLVQPGENFKFTLPS